MSKTSSTGIFIDIEVKPNAKYVKVEQRDGKFVVHVKEPAEKNKANLAIIKLFSKLAPCRIVSGLASKKKKLLIGATEEKFIEFVSSISNKV